MIDEYLTTINDLLLSTNSWMIKDMPIQEKPVSLDSHYKFPEGYDDLVNEDLASLALKLGSWRSYLLVETSKAENNKRLLKEKYGYIYNQTLAQELYRILKEVTNVNGKVNVRAYEIGERLGQEIIKNTPEVLKSYTELEVNEINLHQLHAMTDILKIQEETLSREISRRQTDARTIGRM